MKTIEIKEKTAGEILDIVKELRNEGYVQGTDFDFAYRPPEYDFMNGHTEGKKTTFTFYNDKLATWFVLRWSWK